MSQSLSDKSFQYLSLDYNEDKGWAETNEREQREEELGVGDERLDYVGILGIVEAGESREAEEVSWSIGLGDETEMKNEWREPGVKALIY